MVKQRLALLLLGIWDAYYMHDRYMLGESLGTTTLASDEQHNNNELRRTASYPIHCTEFPNTKAIGKVQLFACPPAMKHRIYYVRGENSTYTTVFDTGIAVSSISRVQFITRQASTHWYEDRF